MTTRRLARLAPLTVLRSDTGFVLRDPALACLLGRPEVLLPLPFTPEARPDDVLAHLRRLNPHRSVTLSEAPGAGRPEAGTQTSRRPLWNAP